MTLERAVEVALEALGPSPQSVDVDDSIQAAAALRAFLEKGLPLMREQQHWLPMLLEVIDKPDMLRDPWREAYYRVQGKEAP